MHNTRAEAPRLWVKKLLRLHLHQTLRPFKERSSERYVRGSLESFFLLSVGCDTAFRRKTLIGLRVNSANGQVCFLSDTN